MASDNPSSSRAGPDAASRPAAGRGRQATRPREIPVEGWKDVAARVREEVAEDRIALAAAGVAFFGFLALVPALGAVVSIYALFTDPAEVQRRVETLFGPLPEEAKQLLSDQLASIVGQAGGALTLGFVVSTALSLWSASSGMGHLIEAVNVAYEERDRRGWLRRKGQALAFTVGAVLATVGGIAAITLLAAAAARLGIGGVAGWALRLAWVPLLVVGFGLGLAALYRFVPAREHAQWRWVTWGSAIALVVWALASVGFQVYVASFGSYNETYGSLAAVVVLLFWLFLTAFVVLVGAEVNAEVEHQTSRDSTTGPSEPLGERGAHVADTVGEARR